MNLTAEYDVQAVAELRHARRSRSSTTIHVRNDSGGPIDRLELNTIAARLGGMSSAP